VGVDTLTEDKDLEQAIKELDSLVVDEYTEETVVVEQQQEPQPQPVCEPVKPKKKYTKAERPSFDSIIQRGLEQKKQKIFDKAKQDYEDTENRFYENLFNMIENAANNQPMQVVERPHPTPVPEAITVQAPQTPKLKPKKPAVQRETWKVGLAIFLLVMVATVAVFIVVIQFNLLPGI